MRYFLFIVTLLHPIIGLAQCFYGSGDSFGPDWKADGHNGWIGSGDNFGKSCRNDGRGGWIGAGDNFGRR